MFAQCVGFSGESTAFVQAIIKANYDCEVSFQDGRLRCLMTCKSQDTTGYLLPHECNLTLSLLLPHHHLQNWFSPPRGSNLNLFVTK